MSPLTHSYYIGASDTQIVYETIGRHFDKVAIKHSTNPALVVRHQGDNWTCSELHVGSTN